MVLVFAWQQKIEFHCFRPTVVLECVPKNESELKEIGYRSTKSKKTCFAPFKNVFSILHGFSKFEIKFFEIGELAVQNKCQMQKFIVRCCNITKVMCNHWIFNNENKSEHQYRAITKKTQIADDSAVFQM